MHVCGMRRPVCLAQHLCMGIAANGRGHKPMRPQVRPEGTSALSGEALWFARPPPTRRGVQGGPSDPLHGWAAVKQNHKQTADS
jgi:hypothetical protein